MEQIGEREGKIKILKSEGQAGSRGASEGQAGSRGGCLKRGDWNPLKYDGVTS